LPLVHAPREALRVAHSILICEEDIRIFLANIKHPLRKRNVDIISHIATTLME
jgi:hypothetical protein